MSNTPTPPGEKAQGLMETVANGDALPRGRANKAYAALSEYLGELERDRERWKMVEASVTLEPQYQMDMHGILNESNQIATLTRFDMNGLYGKYETFAEIVDALIFADAARSQEEGK